MFFNNNNIDDNDAKVDNFDDNKKVFNFKRNKAPLIIIFGAILVCVLIVVLFSLLGNGKDVTFKPDKIYYINLSGEATMTLYQGGSYNEPGYSAQDDAGNDVTSEVVVTNSVNTDMIGEYKVSYTIGNITKERIVKVIEKPIGATYIHLYGDVNTYLYVGESYQEKGYEVIDTVDSNLKDKVKVNNNVNTSKEGIYKVIYSVTNSSNVTTSKERTVIVMDRNLSLIPNITDITNKSVTINIYAKDELFNYLVLPNNNKTTERMTTYEVNSNGKYKFVMYNKKGESKEKEIEITNIDRENPTGNCSGYTQNNNAYITVNASDNVGISKYMIGDTSYTSNNITINSALTAANIIIYDKAGNTVSISCTLENKGGSTPSTSASNSSSSTANSPSSSSGEKKYKKTGVVTVSDTTRYHINGYTGMKFYLYSQCEGSWSRRSVAGGRSTFCGIGCGLTTQTVIISGYKPSVTPTDSIRFGDDYHHERVIQEQTDYKFSCQKYSRSEITNEQIFAQLSKGNVASVKVWGRSKGGASKFTSSQHFMALIDYYKGEIFVGNAYKNSGYGQWGWYDAWEVLTSLQQIVICKPKA